MTSDVPEQPRSICELCFRPVANEHDWATVPEGEGDWLCWGAGANCEDRRSERIRELEVELADAWLRLDERLRMVDEAEEEIDELAAELAEERTLCQQTIERARRLRQAVDLAWRQLRLDGQETHRPFGDACGVDACRLCLAEVTLREALNVSEDEQHNTYVQPVWAGYRAQCWECDWQGPVHERKQTAYAGSLSHPAREDGPPVGVR